MVMLYLNEINFLATDDSKDGGNRVTYGTITEDTEHTEKSEELNKKTKKIFYLLKLLVFKTTCSCVLIVSLCVLRVLENMFQTFTTAYIRVGVCGNY